MNNKKFLKKLKRNFIINVLFTFTLALFILVSWRKLIEIIGTSNVVWLVTGLIVIIGIVLGFFNYKTIFNKFA